MRVVVVANRFATAHDPQVVATLRAALLPDHDVDMIFTTHRGNAVDVARDAMRSGCDAVVAYGGDGSVNEVINGLLSDGLHPGVPRLGVVPAGSTNVFVRALGLPKDPPSAVQHLAAALTSGSTREISLGRADERWFCFSAGLGFDAAIVHAVEAQRSNGHRSTHLLYARMGVRAFFASDRSRPHLRVELADGTVLPDVHFTIVTNCDPWTFVGALPLHPTPHTSFDTGLGLYARRQMGMAGLLLGMGAMTGSLSHVFDKHPVGAERTRFLVEDLDNLTVVADEPQPFQIDGDAIDVRAKVTFSSTRRALSVAM